MLGPHEHPLLLTLSQTYASPFSANKDCNKNNSNHSNYGRKQYTLKTIATIMNPSLPVTVSENKSREKDHLPSIMFTKFGVTRVC